MDILACRAVELAQPERNGRGCGARTARDEVAAGPMRMLFKKTRHSMQAAAAPVKPDSLAVCSTTVARRRNVRAIGG